MPAGEPFSWPKFWTGITDIVAWAKFASFWVKVAMIVVPLVTGVIAYKVVYNRGYVHGQKVTEDLKDQEFREWIAAHPQQTISGSTVNNNVQPKDNHFRMSVWPLTIGWCS